MLDSLSKDFDKLTFNAKLLLLEMHRRGIEIKMLGDSFIVSANFNNHIELLYDVTTSLTPAPIGIMAEDKYYTKKLLMHFGFKVPKGSVFRINELDKAIKYADKIGYPVVVKPTVGSHGDGVCVDIDNAAQLKASISKITKNKIGNGYFIVEKQIEGKEYRLFITKNGFFAAVHRDPANIIGDGKKSIKELVKSENYKRMNPRNTCLCEIPLDQVVITNLNKNGLNLYSVPLEGEKIYLRKNSNVSTGGNCYEVTDKVHPSYKILATDILSAFNLPFIGIDILCKNINNPIGEYAICELNGAPGLSMHMMPEKGASQDVASAVVDVLYPETVI